MYSVDFFWWSALGAGFFKLWFNFMTWGLFFQAYICVLLVGVYVVQLDSLYFFLFFVYIYIFQFLCTCVFCKLYLFVASEGREILVACATVVIFLAYEFHSPRILSIVGNYINPIKSIMAEFFIYKSFLCSCLHFFQAYF